MKHVLVILALTMAIIGCKEGGDSAPVLDDGGVVVLVAPDQCTDITSITGAIASAYYDSAGDYIFFHYGDTTCGCTYGCTQSNPGDSLADICGPGIINPVTHPVTCQGPYGYLDYDPLLNSGGYAAAVFYAP